MVLAGTSPSRVLSALEAIAPLSLAAEWDNVGLLLQAPSPALARGDVRSVALTIDVTESVTTEVLERGAQFVVAYHPPIFQGLKRLTCATPRGRSLTRLLQAGVSVYSPHTALDAARGGINDWLIAGLGEVTDVEPIEAAVAPPEGHDGAGQGRACRLKEPQPLSALRERIKAHLGLEHVRVASAEPDPTVRRIAVCPGSGGAVFAKLRGCDLLVTGEMRHHDVLGHQENGTSVLLTDHTNTERGYLPLLARKLSTALDDAITIHICQRDADPLRVV